MIEITSKGVPFNWNINKIEDITSIKTGGTPSTKIKEYWEKGNIPWMVSGDIHKEVVRNISKKITKKGLQNSAAKLLPTGSVMVALNGQGATKGMVAYLEIQTTCNQSLAAIIPNEIFFNSKYLYFNLQNRYKEIRGLADLNARTGLNLNLLKRVEVLLPPLDEQKEIAAILSTVDDLIENTDYLINSYSLLKKGLMQTLLTKGIGHKKFKKTEIGEIPEEWELISLEKLGSTYNGLTGKNKEHFGKGKPYIPYKNIFNNTKIDINYLGYVTIEENEKQNKVKYGDVLFTTSSETAEEVGYSSVLLDDLKETYLNSFCFGYRLNNFNKIKPEFLRYLLRGQAIRKLIIKIAQGYTRFNLSKVQVLKNRIPVPPVVEQLKISKILSKLDEYLSIYIAKKEELKLLKKGLMQQLLTGRIRVKI